MKTASAISAAAPPHLGQPARRHAPQLRGRQRPAGGFDHRRLGRHLGAGTLSNNGLSGGVNLGLLPAPGCVAGALVDFLTPNTLGLAERDRNLRGDLDVVFRGQDVNPDNSGQFGLALRWYSEELGATEFSLYYMNYHSRLPFLQITAGAPTLGISTTGVNVNITPEQFASGSAAIQGALAARFAPSIGCINPAFGPGAAPGVFIDPRFAALRSQAIADRTT